MIQIELSRLWMRAKVVIQHTIKGKNSRIWHATFLRSCLELQLQKRNAMNQYDTDEIDVSIWNDKYEDGLPFINNIFLVECKNWSGSVGSVDVNWFVTKVEDRGLDFGVLLATNGITKESNEIKRAQSILSGYLRKHIRIIVIDKEEMLSLNNTEDMVRMIKGKICELVVNG